MVPAAKVQSVEYAYNKNTYSVTVHVILEFFEFQRNTAWMCH